MRIPAVLPLALSAMLGAQTQAQPKAQPWIGRPAPAFTLRDLEGRATTLQSFRGRAVVLHITATWCPYCAAEIQGLLAIDKDYRGRPVQVLMVDVKEPKATVAQVAARHGVAFPVLLDPKGAVARAYCPEGAQPELARDEVALASNLLIDREGRIRYFSLFSTGAYDARLGELRKALDGLLAETP